MPTVTYFDTPPRRRTRRAAAKPRSWRARLRPASWRGVPFYIEEGSAAVGRRFQMHEYPQRDTPWAEDLGRRQRTWNVTGYVLGDGYMALRDRMISACEQSGTGKLVHPYLGDLNVVCVSCNYTERDQDGGICRFQFVFAEPGQGGAPWAQRAIGAALRLAGGDLIGAAIAAFAGFSFHVAGFQDFVADAAAADLERLAAILEGLRGPTVQTADQVALEARQRILALATLDPASVPAETIAQVVIDAVAAFANSVTPALALDGLDTLTLVVFPATQPPTPTPQTPGRLQQVENSASLTALVQQAAIAALPGPVSAVPLQVYEDLVAVRTRVVDLCDRVLAEATDPAYQAIDEIRAQAIADLTARGASLLPLRRYTTAFPRPSLVLALRLYQDPSRNEELVARTGAIHPGFLPLTGLVASS